MKFTIIRSQTERLRLRVGKYIFNEEQGLGLSALLLGFSGVTQVDTCVYNGSILILHEKTWDQDAVFTTMNALTLEQIPTPVSDPNDLMKSQEKEFHWNLIKLVGGFTFRRYCIPAIISPYISWYRSLPFLYQGFLALCQGKTTVELLDATAIGTSLVTKDYATASSTMFLLKLSDLLLGYSNVRAKNQLAQSLAVKSNSVWLVEEGQERQIPIEELAVGQVIRLRQGSMIPVDGSVVAGDASVNEATMTGEPLPVHKKAGSTVFAGTLIEGGEMDVLVRTQGSDTRIAQIVDFIHNGEETKAQIQGKAEHLADQIVPISFGLFLGTLALTQNMSRALSVLMVDFSCAIKLTTPISVISALKEGAEAGLVVKGGKYLELLSQVDTIVFDKTGTLTEAVPKISKILTISQGYEASELLTIAACLEEHFPHSVANAIVAEAKEKGLVHPEYHSKVEYIVAHGIVARQEGLRYCIGSKHFIFEDEKIPYPREKEDWIVAEIGSDSAVYLAIDGVLAGIICISDPPRAEAAESIASLRELGISEIIMITGDQESTAAYISQKLGLDSYVASVLPDGKAKWVKELKAQGKTVLMVGDGINDAPALSCANVSMTLAGSSDLAREVADITILSHDLRDIVKARQLSTALMEKISWHYGMIVSFNSLLLGLGIFGLTTAATNALLHNLSTLGFATLSTTRVLPRHGAGKEL